MSAVIREIVENATGVVDSANTQFTTSKPYVANTLSVYIDGQLKVQSAPDGWSETDPAAGKFQTTVPPIFGSTVQASYTDADNSPLIHPLHPINIKDVTAPMVVRIQLVGGFVFTPVGYGIAEVQRNARPRPYRITDIVARVINNDFPQRRIQVDYQRNVTYEHMAVTVSYQQIAAMEKQIEGTFVSDNSHRLRMPAYVPVLGIF